MRLNTDLSRRTVVHAGRLDWVRTPAAGVERRMLFRIGQEQARATSIVRYAPASRFARHTHPGGEEFLVLEGVFEDDAGAYPAGSYVRNPPGSAHAPASTGGCVIFVKLWQFRQDDLQPLVWRAGAAQATPAVLFDDSDERVWIGEWAAGAPIDLPNARGLELLVLSGGFTQQGERFSRWSWLRLPAGSDLKACAAGSGARIWLKSAPLLHATVCAF